MELPIIEIPALAGADGAPVLEVPEGERASVLVVDDNPAKLASLAAIVAEMGLEVVAASSGREALRQLLVRDFALILLDVMMPTLDGYETAQLIHSRPRSAWTPIIFITAEAHSETDRYKAYAHGAVDWIYSPIVPEILQAKVRVFANLFYLARIARRQAEALQRQGAEILRQNAQLEEASRMKSDFLASMSHELRTPLNAIIGFSELLHDGLLGPLTAEQKESVGDIRNSGQHLLSLINDILDLSKVEAGQMVLDPEPFCVKDMLDACLSIVRERALRHGIVLELEADQRLGDIVADIRKAKQILYNLLSNAVKFTPDGGKVRLVARRVGREAVKIEPPEGMAARALPLPPGGYAEFLEIAVCDNGIGIGEADLGRLFQAFLQLDSSLARRYEGTGLGLALVRKLCALHGGTVGVVSAPGKGACFIVWLPWRAASLPSPLEEEGVSSPLSPSGRGVGGEGEQAPAPSPPAPPPRGGRGEDAPSPIEGEGEKQPLALVIEDDEKAAQILRLILENQGFRVAWAADGERGLALAAAERPALISLDLLLPGLGGWEALQRIRTEPRLAGVPVVICSVVADQERGYALGAARVLQKPVSRATLIDALTGLGFGCNGRKEFTVLVVDDNPQAVDLVAKNLSGSGAEVVRAYGGREAIATALQMLPDLVVLDLMMPNVNGFDVVEALKSRPETAGVPILILTAKEITATDRRRLNGYVEKIVQKGKFNTEDFLREVKRAMGKKKEEE